MIIDLMCHRFSFMQMYSKGIILDVGCADASEWKFPIPTDSITNPLLIKDIILVDCDQWNNNMGLKFIRAFAENIPLPNLSVDTVIYGDILEHVKDPNIVIQEGKRLTKDRIIISVPLEFEWESNNSNVQRFITREQHIKDGKDMHELSKDCTIRHPSGGCIDALDDVEFNHIHHTRYYTEKTFSELLKRNFEKDIWEYYIFKLKYNTLNFVNLGAVIWRKNNIDTTDYSILKNRPDIMVV